ncbi:MAG: phenylacetate-CoA ligase [Kiritimatiellia bacterium]|jgi:phenylacetate-CoA ligase
MIDRNQLLMEQRKALAALLEEIMVSNPFYQQKFAGAELGDLSSIPFTTRDEWAQDQLDHPPYGTNLTYPLPRYTRYCQTSGSTGKPMKWLDTQESWRWMLGNWQRVLVAAGLHAGDKVFFAFSFGPFLGFWTAFEAATQMGCMALPGGGLSSAGRLNVMTENKVDALCCTPTYAIHLGEAARAEGVDVAGIGLRTIIVAGEPGGSIPATRRRIEALWPGARVFDHHGMTEVGPVTYETPAGDGLIVMEESYMAEIIDVETGQASPEGELVLTALGRVGSPLIRYRTGDRVKGEIRDGRLVLLGGILGRADDMVIIRGVNIFPGAVEAVVRGFDEVAEFMVHVNRVDAMAEITLTVEPAVTCKDSAVLVDTLEAALKRAFSMRVPVRLAAEPLPRFEMKANRWITN